MKAIDKRLMVAVTVASLASTMLASGFRNPPAGADALGRTGGKIALSDGVSSVEHNPANMVEIEKASAGVSLTVINTGTEFTSPFGSATTEDEWKYLPNVFGVLPSENHQYAVGLGVTTPFGQSTVWDQSGAFHYTAPYSAELIVVNVNPSIAVKLCDAVSVAAGLDVYMTQLELKQAIPWSYLTGLALPDGVAHLKGDGQGVGGNAAITYHLTKAQSLALTYRSPVTVDLSGDSEFSGAEMLGMSSSGDFESSMEFPAMVGLGYGIELTDTIRIGADVEWIEFSRYDSLTLDAGASNPLLNGSSAQNPMAPLVLPQNWKDTWNFGVGGDWKATESLTLRAGYIYLESPVPDETLAPTLPDASRHVVTVGAGIKRGAHVIDLAYGYSFFPDRTVTSDQNPAYDGTYETTSHLMSISYGYSF